MKTITLFLMSVFFLMCGCDKTPIDCNLDCEHKVVVSETQYKNAPNDALHIYETEILGDCLRIRFGSSGCSGNSWVVKLVASENEYFSIPPQRDVRLSLANNEMCEAYFTRDVSFDIRDLRSGADKVILNIINADTSVLYEY